VCTIFFGGENMDETYMREALKQAEKAFLNGEVPVGAVIVKNGVIIARAYNKKEQTKDATNHAEILAIKKACALLKDWRLNGCVLYVTLKPCLMCESAAQQARLERIVYGADSAPRKNIMGEKKKIAVTEKILEKECSVMLKTFFKKRRQAA
jgi:tRNA(adenine34) deaminase